MLTFEQRICNEIKKQIVLLGLSEEKWEDDYLQKNYYSKSGLERKKMKWKFICGAPTCPRMERERDCNFTKKRIKLYDSLYTAAYSPKKCGRALSISFEIEPSRFS